MTAAGLTASQAPAGEGPDPVGCSVVDHQTLMATPLPKRPPAAQAGEVCTGSFATAGYGEADQFIDHVQTISTTPTEKHS